MKTHELNSKELKQRISGKVDHFASRDRSTTPEESETHSQEILALYKKLLDLKDKEDSELSKAICYGMKILKGRNRKKNSYLPSLSRSDSVTSPTSGLST